MVDFDHLKFSKLFRNFVANLGYLTHNKEGKGSYQSKSSVPYAEDTFAEGSHRV